MKQHLKSSEHQSSEKLHKEENLLYSTKGIPSQKLSEKCTENSMFVAQLMASYSLSYRFYPELIVCIDKMMSNIKENTMHLLGNRNHSHMAVKPMQVACFETLCEKIQNMFLEKNNITCASKRIMLSVDKGTTKNDVERQAIVCTVINDKGYPQEILLSVTVIYDKLLMVLLNI